jgi:Transposase IS66 family.
VYNIGRKSKSGQGAQRMKRYTEDQLKDCSKEELIDLFLDVQNRALAYEGKLALNQANQFGTKSEKLKDLVPDGQIGMAFNEAEAAYSEETPEPTAEEALTPEPNQNRQKKEKGKRARDLSKLPHRIVSHELPEEEVREQLGEGWIRLPDQIYKKVERTVKVEVLEHHVAVYTDKAHKKIVKAPHPMELLNNSIVTPSLAADVLNMKYADAMPLNRIAEELKREGLNVGRNVLSSWVIRLSERYMSLLYDRLREEMLKQRILQADETYVRVTEDMEGGRLGKSVMWVFRSGEFEKEHPVILFDYQKTREAAHPEAFLKGWSGILESDAYSGYKKLDRENEGITSAFCWAHAKRPYADDLKVMRSRPKEYPEEVIKGSLAYEAEKQIAAIYAMDNREKKESPEVRLKYRCENLKPLVDAYFDWCREHQGEAPAGSKVDEGIRYSLNQEPYLRVFLEDGEVPIDNLASERAIKPFAVGRRNWLVIDTKYGARTVRLSTASWRPPKPTG